MKRPLTFREKEQTQDLFPKRTFFRVSYSFRDMTLSREVEFGVYQLRFTIDSQPLNPEP